MQSRPNTRTDENQQHISSEVISDSPVEVKDTSSLCGEVKITFPPFVKCGLRTLHFSLLESVDQEGVEHRCFPLQPMASKFLTAHNFHKQPPNLRRGWQVFLKT